MRKILLSLIFIFAISSCSYGTVSEDMSVYVRQDVFDAKMEAFMSEIKLMNEQVLNRVHEEIVEIKTDMRVLNSRMDGLEKRMSSLETMIYWVLATLGVAFAALAVSPYLNNLRKPSLTLEDVKRLIEENNLRLNSRLQV